MLEELRRMALITSGVAELTKNRAEQIVKDFVKSGDVRKDQTSGLVKELLRRSQENRRELTRFVRSEISHQIEGLGLASSKDLERLERRITRLESTAPKVTPAASAGSNKKKPAAKKTTAKKKATTKKTTGSKSSVKKKSVPASKAPVASPNDTSGAGAEG
jgi:polyhydroxyalkanoate synthesis regulator phasin